MLMKPVRDIAGAPPGHYWDGGIIDYNLALPYARVAHEFLAKMPRGKLIDRSDFKFYGLDHDARIRAWRQAMDEGERLRDEFAAFVARPDVGRIRPL
jgi:hypothetical protein